MNPTFAVCLRPSVIQTNPTDIKGKISTLLLLLLLSFKSFSQDSKILISASYPHAFGNNYVAEMFTGVVDLGGKYAFSETDVFNIGASLNTSVLSYSSNANSFFTDFSITSYLIQPRAYAELRKALDGTFYPYLGLGYAFLISDASGIYRNEDVDAADETDSGVNVNLGVTGTITGGLIMQVQLDYTKILTTDEGVDDNNYFIDVLLLKFGIGLRL